jgi:acyl carrier protein
MQLEKRVISVIRNNVEDCGDVEITSNTELVKELGIDSFGAMMIILGLGDEFSINLEDFDFSQFKTVQDVVEHLKERYPQLQTLQ